LAQNLNKMKYKVIDNFLSDNEFSLVRDIMLGDSIEWGYTPFVTEEYDDPKKLNDFQFTHLFYSNGSPRSRWMEVIDPLLQKINPSAIVRVKANLQPVTEKTHINDFHLDHKNFNGKVAIFYVNSNNGYTLFKDGTKIESIENRLLVFDGDLLHTGTTCTDQKVRVVINFMFYQWTNSLL